MISRLLSLLLLVLMAQACNQKDDSVQSGNVESVVSIFAQDMYYEQLTDGHLLKFDEVLTSLHESLVFDSLILDQSQLVVLRISDQNCSVCVDAELEELERLQQKLTEKQGVVLASFENKRELRILTEGVEKLGVPIFSIRFDKVNLPIEEANIPYYFALSSDRSVSNVFIPKKSFPDLTNAYFTALATRLNGEQQK